MLLDNGATINDKGGTSCDGVTALHDACGNGALDVVQILLDRGANASLKTDLGNTPLQSLDEWRRPRMLTSDEQAQYEVVRNRLVQKLEKAGINITPVKKNDNDPCCSSAQIVNRFREKSATPRKRILSMSSDSSNGSRTNGGLFDSEEIETVDDIIQEAFPSIEVDYEASQIIIEPEYEDLNYRQVITDIRENNLQNHHPTSSNNFQPVAKITKRPGLLAADEVDDDDWLIDDIGQPKKKRRTGGSNEYPRLSLSGGTSRTPRATGPIISDCGISSTFGNVAISDDDDDDNSVDAFAVLMSATDNPGRRKRSSGSCSNRSSRDNAWRQQSSLLDNGFTRYRTESPETAQSPVSSTIISPLKINPNCPPSSMSYSVKVRVETNLLNVPVNRNNADDLTIEWLAEEAAKRYYK